MSFSVSIVLFGSVFELEVEYSKISSSGIKMLSEIDILLYFNVSLLLPLWPWENN